jgi:transposase
MLAVGIDIGKRTHEACFLDSTGQPLGRSLRFANTTAGVAQLEERLQGLPEPATIAVEASGPYWLGLHRRLTQAGLTVPVVNPLQTDAFRKTGVRQTKTDRRDAFVLADLVRIGRAKPNYVPDDTILQLRELTRFRWDLRDRVGDVKRRLLTVLDRVFPEFADQFSDPFGTSARELLARAASAAEFAELDIDELTTVLERVSRKRLGRTQAETLHRCATESLGLACLGAVAPLEVRSLLDQLTLLRAQVREVDAAIAKLVGQVEQHLTSIPGLGPGPTLAATILAEIGDISRFPRLEALVAYAGIDPSVFASGGFQGKRQHISKRGSPYLRRALFLAAHGAQTHHPDLAAYLQRKLAEGKPYKLAVVALAHRLLARIYVVLKNCRPYERLGPGQPVQAS